MLSKRWKRRARLGAERVDELLAAGNRMELDAAVAWALRELDL